MKFLDKLSANEIVEFLNGNGLIVLDNVDEVINFAKDDNLDKYYIRCMLPASKYYNPMSMFIDYLKNKKSQEIVFNEESSKNGELDAIRMAMSSELPSTEYGNTGIDIYTISDFAIHRLFGFDFPNDFDFTLQKNYVLMMTSKFGEDCYGKAYDDFVDEMVD